MEIRFLSQPDVSGTNVLEYVTASLDSGRFQELQIATGWAFGEGVRLLAPALKRFRGQRGTASLICGLSRGAATVEGLEEALDVFDDVFVSFDPSGRTVHAKIFLLIGDSHSALVVGSQNLSQGGLVTNHEAGLAVEGEPTSVVFGDARNHLAQLRDDRGITRRLDPELLGALKVSGQVRFAPPLREPDGDAVSADPIFFHSTRAFRAAHLTRKPSEPSGGATPSQVQARDGGTVVHRWHKRLPAADAQRLGGNSNPTNTVTLTQASHPIDKDSWFREVLFGQEVWSAVPGSANHERAAVTFEVRGLGESYSEHMFVEHNRRHESGQGNRSTSVRWGERTRATLRDDRDVTGMTLTVERMSDRTYRLTFAEHETGTFL